MEGHPDLVRDTKSKAILNVDVKSREAHLKKRQAQQQQQEEINTLKRDVDDIKSMLSQILEKI